MVLCTASRASLITPSSGFFLMEKILTDEQTDLHGYYMEDFRNEETFDESRAIQEAFERICSTV